MVVSFENKKSFINGDFIYEFECLLEGYRVIIESSRKYLPEVKCDNILLVGYLTHVRNLYEFFYKGPAGNHASVVDFIPSWSCKNELLDQTNKRLNTYLSHLSYGRDGKFIKWQPWHVPKITEEFINVTKSFLKELPEEYIDEGIKNLKKKFI